MEHKVIPVGEIHPPHNWRVANAAARLALTVTDADVGKYLWQQDDESQWMLVEADPNVWHEVGGAVGVASVSGTGAISVNNADPENPIVSVNGTTLADYGIEDAAPLSHVGSGGSDEHADVVAGGASGFMTGADKTKLNGIATGANNYVLPTASGSTLGGVKVGSGLTIDGSGVMSTTGGGGGGTVDSVTADAPVAVDNTDPANPVISLPNATTSDPGAMSAADKTKLDGVASGATANTGTVTNVTASGALHVANGTTTPALTIDAATTSVPGTMSAADKTKLDGVAAGATANVGTVTNVTGTAPIQVASGTSAPVVSITGATTGAAGSMSAADKSKLDGIAAGATVAPTNTDGLTEGSTNLYFTAARVLAALLTGLSVATGGAIVSTDSVLIAFGKLQKQITDLTTTVSGKLTNPITTLGDLIVGGVSGAVTRLGIGATGQVLTVVGGAPAWATPGFNSMIRLAGGNGGGSSATAIRRFSTLISTAGSDITYADSAINGATFTINVTGQYAISYQDAFGASEYVGISLNSSQLSTSIDGITSADRLIYTDTQTASASSSTSWTGYLVSGSVIRPHGLAPLTNSGASLRTRFTIARVG